MREEQKKVIQKEMDRLKQAFRYYSERTDQLQFTSCLSKMKRSKFVSSLQ